MEQPHAIHCLSASSGGPPSPSRNRAHNSYAQERNSTHAVFKLCGVINELPSQKKISEIKGYLHLSMRMVSSKVSCSESDVVIVKCLKPQNDLIGSSMLVSKIFRHLN